MTKHNLPLSQRLESNSERITESGCQIWTASLNSRGYGHLRVNGIMQRAHRLSFQLNKGAIPKDGIICHKCDTPSCINPDHLFMGSHADNMEDRNKKKRQAFGERNAASVLCEADVLCIKIRLKDGDSHRAIAKDYSVSKSTITWISLGKTWRHLNG